MKLYFKYISMILKGRMQYKASFAMATIGQFLVTFTEFLGVFFMFQRFNSVAGFTFSEVLLCYSIVLLAFSISECFFRGFDLFPNLIRQGEFDRILLRPRSVVFQVLCSNFDLSRVGRFGQGVVMLTYAILQSGVHWSGDKIFALSLMLIGGVVIYCALFMMYAGVSFFTIEGIEFMNILTYGTKNFGSYPFVIYGDAVLKFLTFILPIALFQYYPLLYIIGHVDNVLYMLAPLGCFLFFIPAYGLFAYGMSRYKSTGS